MIAQLWVPAVDYLSYCKELDFLIPESSHSIVTNYDKWTVWIFFFLTQRPHMTPKPNNPYEKY